MSIVIRILVTLGGHSTLDPLLPIPNRIVKRSCADDSVYTHVKVGYRQALYRNLSSKDERFFFVSKIFSLILKRACYTALSLTRRISTIKKVLMRLPVRLR